MAMSMNGDESWRGRALRRTLVAAEASHAAADRMALLREAARLGGGRVVVPGHLLRPGDRLLLDRFSLEAAVGDNGQITLLLVDDVPRDKLDETLSELLRLDPSRRQPYKDVLADGLLRRLSCYSAYRTPTQKAGVRAMATMPPSASLLVTMPTGAGKSLIFELAALLWQEQSEAGRRCCLVVIVPTVALALSHEKTLKAIPGLSGSRALTGDDRGEARQDILNAFRRGEVPILLLSPELALNGAAEAFFEAALPPSKKAGGLKAHLAGVFVDEAHIIQSWGRSFRPDFQRLPALVARLRTANPDLKIVLLSATVGDAAREEIERAYAGEGEFLAIDAGVPRYELDFLTYRFADPQERDCRLISIIDRLPRPAMVYVTEPAHANRLAERLREDRGYQRLEVFTGELTSSVKRQEIVRRWRDGELDLMLATSAFGMGIDKADVRAVVHACVPESPARYYQEIGRASRDGFQGLALMLWSDGQGPDCDWTCAYSQAGKGWLTEDMLKRRWRAIVDQAEREGRAYYPPGGGALHIAVPLDARHDEIGHKPTEYNRLWNMSLLNLLQRSGRLSVVAVEEDAGAQPVWLVEIEDTRLLDDMAGDDLWDAIVEMRHGEQKQAFAELKRFEALIRRPQDTCFLSGVFKLVEAGAPLVDPCGRCHFCRSQGISPPVELAFGGLASVWERPARPSSSLFGPGLSVLHPRDPYLGHGLDDLLDLLHRAGLEQFLVPDGMGTSVGEAAQGALGFVMEHCDLLAGWGGANLPTACLIPAGASNPAALFKRVAAFSARWPEQTFVLVAGDGVSIGGRPLAQIASNRAPFSESAMALSLGGNE